MKRLTLLFGAVFLAACGESAVEPAPATSPAAVAAQAGIPSLDVTGTYIFAGSSRGIGMAESAVTDAGGTVVRTHSGAGILIASGLDAETANSIAGLGGINTVAADAVFEDPVSVGDVVEMGTELAHDPTQAFFFQLGLQWDMEVIEADDAWNAGATGEGVTVAILDSGIDATHPDLAGLVDAGRSIAFVANTNPTIPAWGDDRFHGTHVAGTVATNGLGTAGVAPHATLMAVKVCDVFGSCPFSAILSGIVYAADAGADVINMSLGGFIGRSGGGGELNSILNQVMNYANRSGVVVVSSAGNDAVDLDHIGRDFGGKQNGGVGSVVVTPCESGNGMCVSATNIDDDLASYSNFGNSAISVAAPGGEGSAPTGVISVCSTQSVFLPVFAGFSCGPTSYLWLSGTSMAAPHVSGTAALLAAQGMSAGQIKAKIQQSADDLGKRGNDPFYGKGRLNVFNAIN